MHRVLGIDTTGAEGGLALLEGGVMAGGRDLGAPGRQAERILVELDDLLHELTLKPGDLDLIAAAIGPGSFTGVRIGMAAAQGLAFGLGIPVVGVSTLAVLAAWAFEVTEGQIETCVSLIDGRRGVFAAIFDCRESLLIERKPPESLQPGDLAAFLGSEYGPEKKLVLCGDGVPVVASEIATWNPVPKTVFPPRDVDRARLTARLGRARFEAHGADAVLEPLYLRPADARKPARPPGAAAGLFADPGPAPERETK